MAIALRSVAYKLTALLKPVSTQTPNRCNKSLIVRNFTATSKFNTTNTQQHKPNLFTLSIWNCAKSLFSHKPTQYNTVKQQYYNSIVKQQYKQHYLTNAEYDSYNNKKSRFNSTGLVALAVALCAANNDDTEQNTYKIDTISTHSDIYSDCKNDNAVSVVPTVFTTAFTYLLQNIKTTAAINTAQIQYYNKFVTNDTLTLTNKNIKSVEQWKYVAQYLAHNNSANTLYIKSVDIDTTVIEQFIQYNALHNIQHIRLYENNMPHSALAQLLQGVQNQCIQLISLTILRNNIDYTCMKHICKFISNCDTLCALNLSCNAICDKSAELLGDTLDSVLLHTNLRDIDLRMNCIKQQGKQYLKQVQTKYVTEHRVYVDIRFNPTLRT